MIDSKKVSYQKKGRQRAWLRPLAPLVESMLTNHRALLRTSTNFTVDPTRFSIWALISNLWKVCFESDEVQVQTFDDFSCGDVQISSNGKIVFCALSEKPFKVRALIIRTTLIMTLLWRFYVHTYLNLFNYQYTTVYYIHCVALEILQDLESELTVILARKNILYKSSNGNLWSKSFGFKQS